MALRNAGQTVSKWTGRSGQPMPDNGRTKAVEDSLVVMVDQIWIWALNKCVCHHSRASLVLVALNDRAQYLCFWD